MNRKWIKFKILGKGSKLIPKHHFKNNDINLILNLQLNHKFKNNKSIKTSNQIIKKIIVRYCVLYSKKICIF